MLALFLAAVLEVSPAKTAIRVDAQLDEPAWAAATKVPVAYEWYPSDNTPAPVETEALVTYDDERLYVAFRAHDPNPALIRARYQERDASAVVEDDLVGFYIDPFNDDRRSYSFRVNPLGVQVDAINSDVERTQDRAWDAIWSSAGRLTADGFVVEIAVPLQQLRLPATRGPQTWGFLAVREWPRDVKHRLRSVRTDQTRDCFVCQFEDLHGFATERSGRNVEVTPTITGTNDDPFDAGVSARWAFTPGTSLQATVNPDFSQVEADAAQLDVNTRFALSFPEKRTFFLEGADVFETRLPLVFTRTIADPSAGVKLTGKSGSSLYGAMFTRDAITNLLVPGDESSFLTTLRGGSTNGFARYSRGFGANATAGGLVTMRRGMDYENVVAAADSLYRLTERDSFRLQLAGSRTTYPDAFAAQKGQPQGAFNGHAMRASYNHSDRDWSWGGNYVEVAPHFRADSGLINQVGVRAGSASAERRIRGAADRWFRNLFIGGGVDTAQQFEHEWREWGADANVRYEGPRQSEIFINLAPNQEYFAGTTYHNFRYTVSGEMQLTRDVHAGLEIRAGETIDFNHAQQAHFITLSPFGTIDLGRHVHAELAYDYQQLKTLDGARIFDVHLPQARVLYHFGPRAFVRTILQYRMLDVVTSESQRLLTQLLFSYRVNAQTVFLAGYSDNYQGDHDLTSTNRALFVKLGYAWLF
ncbi:MAG: carbohydrate binding family 9 domain-containing protein [Acidobacteriota bacterium]|nr:carbohydrate binding family 9 domain-containing protein [Acidobacteriota bacterium]